MKEGIFNQLKKGLIVSCQALEDEPLYHEEGNIMWRMALAAKEGGAVGIRANSIKDIVKIKEKVDLPVIGLIKRCYDGYPQHITVTMKEIKELYNAKVEIIAFDCTQRKRPDGRTVNEFVSHIKGQCPGILLMADISTLEEGILAEEAGVDFVGTTLSGYTPYSHQCKGPDFQLIEALSERVGIPIIAEGRITTPSQAKKALDLGAYAVVVGGAITRPLEITKRFIDGMNEVETN